MRAIDFHTHPVFMGNGCSRAAVHRLAARSRALGIERMVVLGDVLAHGRRPNARQLAALRAALPPSRLMFGSHTPFHVTLAPVEKFRPARPPAAAQAAIGAGNAARFFAR